MKLERCTISVLMMLSVGGCSTCEVHSLKGSNEFGWQIKGCRTDAQDSFDQWLSHQDNKEQVTHWYFSAIGSPYEKGTFVDFLGSTVIDGMQCGVDKLNAPYHLGPAENKQTTKRQRNRSICSEASQFSLSPQATESPNLEERKK